RNQLSSGNKLQWTGIGTLSRGLSGETKFEPDTETISPALAIPAVKVLRENAEHTVRVGEDQKTSVEMRELLHTTDDGKKSLWWVVALVIAILSLIFIGYHFSTKGLTTSAASNQKKLVPEESR
ncbi:MAG: hypothetical protein ABI480_15360, partial [Chitinophagaceae bacterium]